jgi:hypothetical protein
VHGKTIGIEATTLDDCTPAFANAGCQIVSEHRSEGGDLEAVLRRRSR